MRRMTRRDHLAEYNKLPLQTRAWVTIQVMGLVVIMVFLGAMYSSVTELLGPEPTLASRLGGLVVGVCSIAAGIGLLVTAPWLASKFPAMGRKIKVD